MVKKKEIGQSAAKSLMRETFIDYPFGVGLKWVRSAEHVSEDIVRT